MKKYLERVSNKTLAYAAWGISAFFLLQAIINACITNGSSTYYLLSGLITAVWQALLGYVIWRDRSDIFTLIIAMIYTAGNFSLPFVLIVALALVKKYARKNDWVVKCWFVPAAVAAFLIIIKAALGNTIEADGAFRLILTILGYLVSILNYLVLGYWALKSLRMKTQDRMAEAIANEEEANQIAFYKDLHNRGVLSDSEFNTKVAEIRRSHMK